MIRGSNLDKVKNVVSSLNVQTDFEIKKKFTDYWGCFPERGERCKGALNYSSPPLASGAEAKNGWSYTFTPTNGFMKRTEKFACYCKLRAVSDSDG
jgi:hypothetical protein